MPSNNDWYRADGRVLLTNHAQQRMARRGLRSEAVHAALVFGRVVSIRGADIYAIGRKEIAHCAEQGIDLSAYDGVQVVTAHGAVLTVYRNRSFNGLRDRRTFRRRPFALAA